MADETTVSLTTALALAGASGLFGVIASEVISLFRERRRLAAEALENTKQRLHDLRRDIYLVAAESTVRLLGAIGRMGDPKTSNEDSLRAAEDFNAAIARVSMVAQTGTSRRVMEFQRAMVATQVKLLFTRQSMAVRQLEIDRASEDAASHNRETLRFIEMMKAINIEGNPDPRFPAIERQAQIANEDFREESENIRRLWSEQMSEQAAFAAGLWPRIETLADLQVNVLVAIRSDLGVDDAVDVLRQELTKGLDSTKAVFHRIAEQSRG